MGQLLAHLVYRDERVLACVVRWFTPSRRDHEKRRK